MSKWNAQAPADDSDWVARIYGQELADMMNKMRAESEARRRAERPREILKGIVAWMWFAVQMGGMFYVIYVVTEFVKSACK